MRECQEKRGIGLTEEVVVSWVMRKEEPKVKEVAKVVAEVVKPKPEVEKLKYVKKPVLSVVKPKKL